MAKGLSTTALATMLALGSLQQSVSLAHARTALVTGPHWSITARTGMAVTDHLEDNGQRFPVDGSFYVRMAYADGFPELQELIRRASSDGMPAITLLWDGWLNELDSREIIEVAGRDQPFSNIDWAFKQRSSGDDTNQAIWVAVGWIAFDEIQPLRDPGDCDPDDYWEDDQCVEKIGEESYVVKIKVGHPGWTVRGFAIAGREQSDRLADALADEMASKATSELMREHYLVVPDDSVRARRSVTFKLYDPKDGSLLDTVSDDPKPDSLDATSGSSDSSDQRNSCGGKASACPMFNVPPDIMSKILHEMGQP